MEVISSSSTNAVAVIVPSVIDPKDIVPVVVILDDPLSIAPNPEVILPLFNAPTVVAAVVTRFGIAVISSSKYAAKVCTVACRIVPASLIINPSPSAIAVVPTVLPPSIKFNSVVVAVTPSIMFSSAVEAVTPSIIFNSAGVALIAVVVTVSNTGI